jgi:hypothetical protein
MRINITLTKLDRGWTVQVIGRQAHEPPIRYQLHAAYACAYDAAYAAVEYADTIDRGPIIVDDEHYSNAVNA